MIEHWDPLIEESKKRFDTLMRLNWERSLGDLKSTCIQMIKDEKTNLAKLKQKKKERIPVAWRLFKKHWPDSPYEEYLIVDPLDTSTI